MEEAGSQEQGSDADGQPPNSKNKLSFLQNLTFVAFVYTFQGIALDFLIYSVETELINKKISNTQLALLSAMQYPFCLKLLWAPFQDAYYIPRIGRRKSWVIATTLVIAIMWGFFSIKIVEYINNTETTKIAMFGIATSILLAFQDVSMDGWIIKLAQNDQQLAKFSWWCSFGYTLGGVLSFNIYTYFSDPATCQEVFGREPMMNAGEVVIFTAICYLILALIISQVPEAKDQFENKQSNILPIENRSSQTNQQACIAQSESISEFSPENGAQEIKAIPLLSTNQYSDQDSKLGQVWRKIRLVTRNKNLKFLMFVLFFSEIGFAYFDNLVSVQLLNLDVSTGFYSTCWFISCIVEGIAGYLFSKYNRQSEMTVNIDKIFFTLQKKIYLSSNFIRVINGLFTQVIYYLYDTEQIDFDTLKIGYLIYYIIYGITDSLCYSPIINFFLKICDSEVEGSYVAILTSVFYCAPIWPAPIILLISDYIDWWILAMSSASYVLIFFGIFGRRIYQLQTLPKSNWALVLV